MALQEVKIDEIVDRKESYRSIAIPSTIHSYSVCLEYLRKWFLSNFEDGFLGENGKNFYIAGRHAFDDFRKNSATSAANLVIKKNKSKYNVYATLACTADLGYNRDTIDLYPFGMNLFLRSNSTVEPPFLVDNKNHIRLTNAFEIMLVEANFKLVFSTKAQQMDMYNYCKMRFRVGATQGEYIDYDQHVPYGIMRQIASDAGFDVSNGRITDIVSFLKYLNMNSSRPFLYKFRNINGKDEFFVRVKNVYVHIAIPEIDHDNGEKIGQATTDFALNFTATVRFPVTKCYIYYSQTQHTHISLKEDISNIACFTTIRMIDAPDYNEKQWRKIFSTEYEDDNVKDDITRMDLSDYLFQGDLGRVLRYTTSIYQSPELFMNIKFYNDGNLVPFTVDWVTGKCASVLPLKSTRTSIIVYADLDYIHNQINILDDITNRGRL